MIKHQPYLSRPETDMEQTMRELGMTPLDDFAISREEVENVLNNPNLKAGPIQAPGFSDPNDPCIPPSIRQAAIRRAQQPRWEKAPHEQKR